MRIDIRADDKSDDVEKRHPGVLGQELLREREGEWGGDPADFHDGHEAGTDGGADLVEGTGAGDEGHGDEVDCILDGRDLRARGKKDFGQRVAFRPRDVGRTGLGGGKSYDQIADEDLKNLGSQTGPAFEEFLQDGDQDVTQWSADEGAVEGHLGYARAQVVAVFTAIVGDP